MSKSQKGKKKGQRRPNLSPLTMLRPRLDGLWGNPKWADFDESTQQADLAALTKGIEAIDFLPVLAKAYAATPAPVRKAWRRHSPTGCSLRALSTTCRLRLNDTSLRRRMPRRLWPGCKRRA